LGECFEISDIIEYYRTWKFDLIICRTILCLIFRIPKVNKPDFIYIYYILAYLLFNRTYVESFSDHSPHLWKYRISHDLGWCHRTTTHQGRVFPSVHRPRYSGSTNRTVSGQRRIQVFSDIEIRHFVAVRPISLVKFKLWSIIIITSKSEHRNTCHKS